MTDGVKILSRAKEIMAHPIKAQVGVDTRQLTPTHPVDVYVQFDDLPTVMEIVAIGKAVSEAHRLCRVVYTHPDAGVLAQQINTTFHFEEPGLIADLPVVAVPVRAKHFDNFKLGVADPVADQPVG